MKYLVTLSLLLCFSILCSAQTFKNNSKVKKTIANELVCKLEGKELQDRKEALQKDIFSTINRTEENELGYTFYFTYNEEFVIKLMDYVLAENNCCPFFNFNISLHSDDDVALNISGTEEMKSFIKEMLIEK
ncbi:MAG: hypothetical protein ACJAZ3_000664 [Sphingobacteriales bacterium]|jgi:hypothetical protein